MVFALHAAEGIRFLSELKYTAYRFVAPRNALLNALQGSEAYYQLGKRDPSVR